MNRSICLAFTALLAIITAWPFEGALPAPPPDLRSPVTYVVAILFGKTIGMFGDPFVWISLVLIAAVSIRYPKLGLLAAAVAATLSGFFAWSWQNEIGVPVFNRLISGVLRAAILYLIAAPIAGITGLLIPSSKTEQSTSVVS